MALSEATSLAEAIQYTVELWYSLVLLLVFVLAAALCSIIRSRRAEVAVKPQATGPGGRPLPSIKKKKNAPPPDAVPADLEISTTVRRMFVYVACGIVLTFLANIINVTAHTVSEANNPENKYAWWCGEEMAVSWHTHTSKPSPPSSTGTAHLPALPASLSVTA